MFAVERPGCQDKRNRGRPPSTEIRAALDKTYMRVVAFPSMQASLRSVQLVGLLGGILLLAYPVPAQSHPSAEISNGPITAKIYLPDPENGFYRSTRFDWSGVIGSLKYKEHDFYGDWFQKVDPATYDFGYDDTGVVSAPFTAMVGLGEEFNTDHKALGYDEAKPGGTFLKIGVGVLRKPDEPKYDHSKTYEIVDRGKWSVKKTRNSVQFDQAVSDPASGYGYNYRKIVRLVPGKPELVLEHTLKNTGAKTISSTVYDHNFWTLDHLPPGPGLEITFRFQLQAVRPINNDFVKIQGKKLVYVKQLEGKDRATASLGGFGQTPADYDIRVENVKAGAGVRIQGDRPVVQIALWSIRTVMAIEPYIEMNIPPGGEFTWTLRYDYYTLAPKP
jgi:hypothetical protein